CTSEILKWSMMAFRDSGTVSVPWSWVWTRVEKISRRCCSVKRLVRIKPPRTSTGDDKTIDPAPKKWGVGDSRPYPRERAGNLIERGLIPAGKVVGATGRKPLGSDPAGHRGCGRESSHDLARGRACGRVVGHTAPTIGNSYFLIEVYAARPSLGAKKR